MENLEAQNDEMIEGLGSKIKMLKDVRESFVGVRGRVPVDACNLA